MPTLVLLFYGHLSLYLLCFPFYFMTCVERFPGNPIFEWSGFTLSYAALDWLSYCVSHQTELCGSFETELYGSFEAETELQGPS